MSSNREEAIALGSNRDRESSTFACSLPSSSLCQSRMKQQKAIKEEDDDCLSPTKMNRNFSIESSNTVIEQGDHHNNELLFGDVDDDEMKNNDNDTITNKNSDDNTTATLATTTFQTLEERCKLLIVKHFEKYPPFMFSMLSEMEWNDLLLLRYKKTKPKTGGNRVMPAIPSKFLMQVEQQNEHLADSAIADKYVWKDCVEYKFKRSNFIYRPKTLYEPYPLVKTRLCEIKQLLITYCDNMDNPKRTNPDKATSILHRHVQSLLDSEIPVNVRLLQDTSIGKTIKQCIKKLQPHSPLKEQLEVLFAKWKKLAKESGIKISSSATSSATTSDDSKSKQEYDDLKLLEQCITWRDLYRVLQERETKLKAEQGERMRERKQKLHKNRPKIVKVTRKANPKRDHILDNRTSLQRPSAPSGGWGSSSSQSSMSSSQKNMSKLRHETSVAMSRSKASMTVAKRAIATTANSRMKHAVSSSSSSQKQLVVTSARGVGFGAAVAFATTKNMSKVKRTHQQMQEGGASQQQQSVMFGGGSNTSGGGKRMMKLPSQSKSTSNYLAVNRNKKLSSAIVKNAMNNNNNPKRARKH